jgi:3,5-epimerase/4-reductase
MKLLIYGHQGFIGKVFVDILKEKQEDFVLGQSRCDNKETLEKEIKEVKPDRVISLAGRVRGKGLPSADYLEQPGKLTENIRDNLYGPVLMAIVCSKLDIHFTYLGTGCIFGHDKIDDDTKGFDEGEKPNFWGSSYSIVKGFTDLLMHEFEDNVLNVRVRLPIVDYTHPLNLITKLTKYPNICSNDNSITNLTELMPIMLDMSKKKVSGTINLTNPGVINWNEILEMYKEIVDPSFTWKNFSIEDQNKVLKSQRSNTKLDTSRLESLYPDVLPVKQSVRKCIETLYKKEYAKQNE